MTLPPDKSVVGFFEKFEFSSLLLGHMYTFYLFIWKADKNIGLLFVPEIL